MCGRWSAACGWLDGWLVGALSGWLITAALVWCLLPSRSWHQPKRARLLHIAGPIGCFAPCQHHQPSQTYTNTVPANLNSTQTNSVSIQTHPSVTVCSQAHHTPPCRNPTFDILYSRHDLANAPLQGDVELQTVEEIIIIVGGRIYPVGRQSILKVTHLMISTTDLSVSLSKCFTKTLNRKPLRLIYHG